MEGVWRNYNTDKHSFNLLESLYKLQGLWLQGLTIYLQNSREIEDPNTSIDDEVTLEIMTGVVCSTIYGLTYFFEVYSLREVLIFSTFYVDITTRFFFF